MGSGKAIDEILFNFRSQGFKDLPKSYRTLNKADEAIKIEVMKSNSQDRSFYLRDIRKTIENRLNLIKPSNLQSLYYMDLSFNGAPAGNSAIDQIWPFQGNLKGHFVKFPSFVLGCYAGKHKPCDMDKIFSKIVAQCNQL